jgi:citrate synthase
VQPASDGLEDVVVAETELSLVDGEAGRLVVRGHDVEALAGAVPFEAMCSLLWDGALPDVPRLERTRRALGRARVEAHEELWRLGSALDAAETMDALRAALSHLSVDGLAPDAARWRITGATAVFAAAGSRARRGERPVPPDPERGHADDLLRLLEGAAPHPARARALDAYLVTVAEHGMNASTFTARVVASTRSDAVSAVVAALGALKGPLHGGAPGPVLDMLDAIGAPEAAEGWLARELAEGRRIMGLGHRVYRVRDPRAAVLERALERLAQEGIGSRVVALARAVEQAAVRALAERHPRRRLAANVEFATAVLLDALGLPRAFFTPTFAVGRVAGWLAHVEEQRARGRLIRPSQRYRGPLPPVAASA